MKFKNLSNLFSIVDLDQIDLSLKIVIDSYRMKLTNFLEMQNRLKEIRLNDQRCKEEIFSINKSISLRESQNIHDMNEINKIELDLTETESNLLKLDTEIQKTFHI